MKTLKIILLLVVFFFTVNLIHAQVEDASKLVKIETLDGNEFIGTISSEDSDKLVLKTENLGEVTISKNDIKLQEVVNQSQIKDGVFWFDNLQATRYFWAPNGYGLKKGEGYYQNIYVLWNQASYGITDNISIGGGIIPLFLFAGAPTPVFITPKISIPIVKDKFNIGGGALLGTIIGDFGLEDEDINRGFGIVYGLSTFGSRDSNISISFGYGRFGGEWADSPLINISGLHRVSNRFYLITENYYFNFGDEDSGTIIGLGGRWIINKAALDFIFAIPIGLGAESFIAIPVIGFTIPFGNK